MEQTLTYKDYLAAKTLPHMWCAGCGNGVVLRAFTDALAELGLLIHEVVVATGIGCWGKADDYVSTHGFHGTHGRALAFASGIKLAKPELTVVALMGDGDAVTIGGNHFIHAARRNIDLTAIIVNNFNYGMTGGQYSATTPLGKITSTSPLGTAEPGFDVCELASVAGANYVARTTSYHVFELNKLIKDAITTKGFSVVEIMSPCPTHFGKNNGLPEPVNMMNWLKDSAVNVKRYEALSEQEKENAFPIGKLVERNRPDFLTTYKKLNNKSDSKGGEQE